MRAIRASTLAPLVMMGIVLGSCESLSDAEPTYWITIEAPSSTVPAPGGTVQLTATVGDETNRIVEGATVTWSSTRPEVASVSADGLVTGHSTGQAVIRANRGSAVGSITLDAVAVGSCAIAGALAVPDTVAGALTADACTASPPWCSQIWVLDPGRSVDATITLASVAPVSPYLLDRRGEPMEPLPYDRGIGYRRVAVTLAPEEAPYFVCVGGVTGYTEPYTLSAIEGPAPAHPCPATSAFPYPGTAPGMIAADDCENAGYRIDSRSLTLDAPSTPRLRVTGDPTRPVLELRDRDGARVAAGEFSVGNSHWVEASEPLPAGVYELAVGVPEGATGTSYTLDAKAGPAQLTCGTEGALAPGSTVGGSIELDDCPLAAVPHPGLADGYDLVVADTTAVELTLTSGQIFPTATITDSAGGVVAFTREPAFADAREVVLAPGRYRAWVKPLYPDQRGAYDFSVDPAGRMPPCQDSGALAPGDSVAGSLTAADCEVQHARRADVWSFRVDDPGAFTARLVTALSGYLVLTDSTGVVIDRDDDRTRDGWVPTLTTELDPGSYRLWATTFWPRETGDYILVLESAQ